MSELTESERAVLRLTRELWNAVSALPVQHPSDMRETERDIHDIQNRIMSRAFMRSGSVDAGAEIRPFDDLLPDTPVKAFVSVLRARKWTPMSNLATGDIDVYAGRWKIGTVKQREIHNEEFDAIRRRLEKGFLEIGADAR